MRFWASRGPAKLSFRAPSRRWRLWGSEHPPGDTGNIPPGAFPGVFPSGRFRIAGDEVPLTEKGRLWQRLGRIRFFRGFAVALGWRGFTAIDFIGFLKAVGGGPHDGKIFPADAFICHGRQCQPRAAAEAFRKAPYITI